MEAGVANLIEPGDKVIVIESGFFGPDRRDGARVPDTVLRAVREIGDRGAAPAS